MQSNQRSYFYRTLLFLGVCVLAVVVLRPSIAQAFWPMIPPPPPPPPTVTPAVPTPTSAPSPTVAPAVPAPTQLGGFIKLRVQFPTSWPWYQVPWQTLYTQVQWLDEDGTWHDVKGWQGELDELVGLQGYKTWWMEEALFGKGPFRWIVYDDTKNSILAISEPFTLPKTAKSAVIEVTLE